MKKLKYSLIGLCSCIALFSCEKDDKNVGASVGGDPNTVGAAIIDTFTINTYSVQEDTVVTSEQNSPLLGAYSSSEVGIAKSSIFATLELDTLKFTYPTDSFAVDSLYLTLHVTNVYGKNIDQEFEVYQLDELVNEDSTYYGFQSLNYTNLMGTITVNVSDSGTYTFPLDSTFGAFMMSADSVSLTSNANFQDFFKGIAIVPKTTGLNNDGAIYQLSRTGIELHLKYHTTYINPPKDFDTEIGFVIEKDNFIFSNSFHDFTGSELEQVINDSTLGNTSFYAQGLMGGIGKLSFPTLPSWYSSVGNVLLNKFELKVYVEDNSTFTLPAELMFTYKNTEGGTSFTTAVLNSTDDSYTFTISSSEVDAQLKLNTFSNMDFSILNPFPGSQPHQIKIYGRDGINPPVLKLYYTKY